MFFWKGYQEFGCTPLNNLLYYYYYYYIICGIAILLADFMCHVLVLPEQKAGDECPFPADSKVATMKNVVCADSSDFHAGVWCRFCWTVCQEELHSLAALLTQ